MNGEQRGHERAPARVARDAAEHQEQQQRARRVQGEVDHVVRAGIHAE